MLRIGYVRLRDEFVHADTAALKEAGCQVVRADEPGAEGQTLASILDFVGDGDQLVVTRLERLSASARAILETLDRLDSRGASLVVLQPQLSSAGESGRTLRAVLEAVAEVEPTVGLRRRRAAAAANKIFALQRAGMRPAEIARHLGVSRMTVWRKLKALETADA